MKRLRVFIAGPYSPYGASYHDASRQAYRNTREAIRVATVVLDRGHWPFIPHLTHFFHLEQERDRGNLYYEWDNAYLDVCEALVQFAASPGADNEYRRAVMNGMWTCVNPYELPLAEDLPDDLDVRATLMGEFTLRPTPEPRAEPLAKPS